jgi:membrane fusion protein (multidrug efflux system)
MTQHSKPQPPGQSLARQMLRKSAAVLIVFAALAVVVLVAALLPKRNTDRPPTDPPPVNVKVLVVQPQQRVLDTFDLHGVVEANRVVSVAAEVAGRIERILVEEGQDVKQGQKVILLNTELLQAEYDLAKAQWEYDQREAARILDASKRGVATSMELDQARTKLSVSKAQYDAAKARLERATIVAPITGRLNRLSVEQGEYVAAGDEVARLVDLARVKVVVDVSERDVPHLELNQAEQIFLDGRSVTGRITYIGELADQAARTTPVEITVKNPQRTLPDGEVIRDFRSGRIVRVRLLRKVLTDAILIPLEAVIPLEKGKEVSYVVYVAEDGRARRREVELGFMRRWNVHVRRGLARGDRLIVSGHRFVSPGQAVRVEATEAPMAPASQPAWAASHPAARPGK